MKRHRHTAAEIICIMRQIRTSGMNIGDACDVHRITRMTYYRWLKRYPNAATGSPGELNLWEIDKRFDPENPLALENAQLKLIVAEQALDIRRLKHIISPGGNSSFESDAERAPGEMSELTKVAVGA